MEFLVARFGLCISGRCSCSSSSEIGGKLFNCSLVISFPRDTFSESKLLHAFQFCYIKFTDQRVSGRRAGWPAGRWLVCSTCVP